jgi:SAM-dependent methyltransferase
VCAFLKACEWIMSNIEFLSPPAEHEFPERLFEIMRDDHFWVRSRFNVFLQESSKLGLNLHHRKLGLDIGCAHGVVQRQLAVHTAWSCDGCDLSIAALASNSSHGGRVLYYNINDCRPELRERYDFIVVFDVLEHIQDTKSFLNAALYHLKPGGYAFVNVPAIQSLFSKFDEVLGHVRRYDRSVLTRHLVEAGLEVLSVRYWALTMIPILYMRALIVGLLSDADRVLNIGFRPPGRLIGGALSGVLGSEIWALRNPVIGACLLAVAQKTTANDT